MSQIDQKSPTSPPPYDEHKPQTVLLIHSLFSPSGSYDWIEVTETLKEKGFQVLAPSLTPDQLSNYDTCVSFLAEEIKKNSESGKAHVVGLSVGAFLAVKLAMAHQDRVSSVLISGLTVYPLLVRPLLVMPIYVRKRMVSSCFGGPAFTLRNCISITKMLAPLRDLQSIEARTMTVVASIHDSLRTALALRKNWSGDADFQAKEGKHLPHLWNRRRPRLFAELIKAWANNTWSAELGAVFVHI